MSRYLILTGILITPACSMLTYVEPESGDRARVRFATDSESTTVLRSYANAQCSSGEAELMRLIDGYTLRGTPKKLGIPLWSYNSNAAKEVFIASDKELHAMFYGAVTEGNYTYSCGIPFSFKFHKDQDYEVFYTWHPKACNVTISQIITNSNAQQYKKVLAQFNNQLNNSNRGCLNKFSEKRWY